MPSLHALLRRRHGHGAATADASARAVALASLLATAALLLTMAAPLLAGRVYVHNDLGAFHLPIRAFYAERLDRGEPFDWMPQLFAGFYLTGEGQGGTYHPLHWLLYRCLPLPTAAGCEWLLAYPLMWLGAWLLLRRRLGDSAAKKWGLAPSPLRGTFRVRAAARCLSPFLRAAPAAFGALTITFAGFNLLHFVHPNAVAVVAHVPWLLWAIDVALGDGRPWRAALAQAGIALLTASQLLLGYPQYVWFSLLAEAAFAGFVMVERRCAPRDGRTEGTWTRLVIAKGIGLLIAGVQVLPTLDALRQSERASAAPGFVEWGSLHPLNLVQLVAPYVLDHRVLGDNTHELGLYAGAVPLVLAVFLLTNRWADCQSAAVPAGWQPAPRCLTWFAATLGAAALLLAFGGYTPLYRLQTWLPGVGAFRFPCRYIVLFHLAVGLLAAIGLTALLHVHQRSRGVWATAGSPDAAERAPWRCFASLGLLPAASLAAAIAGVVLRGKPHVASLPAVLAGPLLFGTAVVLLVLGARGSRAALVALVLLAAADLGYYGLSSAIGPHTARWDDYVASAIVPPGEVDGRLAAAPFRCDEPGKRMGNQALLAGWSRADGYAGLQPRRRLDYRSLSALRAAGVRWVRRGPATEAIAGLTPCNADWLEVPEPLPRFRLVARAVATDDPARDIERIDLRSAALSEVPLALPGGAAGECQVLAESPGRLQLAVRCDTPQLLVVAESFHAGWQATLEVAPTAVLRVNGDFLGCVVPAGEHRVTLSFQPRSLALGRLDTCLGLALLPVCFVGLTRRRNPQPLAPNP